MPPTPGRSHAPPDPVPAIHCGVEGMDAKIAVAVPLSSPNAAQRCAEGAGLDSGTATAEQFAMPSIATGSRSDPDRPFSNGAEAFMAPQLQSRISTSLTDVTAWPNRSVVSCTL